MADLAKFFVLVLIIPLCFAVVHCGRAGCNTVVHPTQQYSGGATASDPYLELGKMETRIWHCDSFTCAVAAAVRPRLHNPLGKAVSATISCSYWVDDLKLSSRVLKPVIVPARRTVRVEVHHGLTIMRQRSRIGADCTAEFVAIEFAVSPVSISCVDYAAVTVVPPVANPDDVHDGVDDATDILNVAL